MGFEEVVEEIGDDDEGEGKAVVGLSEDVFRGR